MSRAGMNRWNAKRDGNEKAVVDALKAVGAKVIRHRVYDLEVFYPPLARLTMVDVKMPGEGLTAKQQQMLDDGWPLQIIDSIELALQTCCNVSYGHYPGDPTVGT